MRFAKTLLRDLDVVRNALTMSWSNGHGQEAVTTEHKGLVGTAAEWIAQGLEAAGLAVLVLGALATTFMFLRRGVAERRWTRAYERYRADLGRAILLGLELLVAADIAGTVAAPLDMGNIAALGVVLIRTFLSFSLEVEINGRWPWQGEGRDPGRARRDPPAPG